MLRGVDEFYDDFVCVAFDGFCEDVGFYLLKALYFGFVFYAKSSEYDFSGDAVCGEDFDGEDFD